MATKKQVTVEELREKVLKFSQDRDWLQFHNAKDLAISLVLEATEVMEHFQWKNGKEISQRVDSHYEDIQDEIADVAIYLLEICSVLNVDFSEAVINKLLKNAEKYPVEKSKGKHTKYTEL